MNAAGKNTYANSNTTALNRVPLQRGLVFGTLIITALLAFEIFNYSTTDFALGDVLGDLRFAGVRWATILAVAFCGIDFAGIARLFTPLDERTEQPTETWYLFGAWMLAATMNAMLTWWGVSLAIVNHQTLGSGIIGQATMLRWVPVFVAIMVWLIRVLIIGTFSIAGDRLFANPVQPVYGSRARLSQPNGMSQSASPQIARPASRLPSRPLDSAPAASFSQSRITRPAQSRLSPRTTDEESESETVSSSTRNVKF